MQFQVLRVLRVSGPEASQGVNRRSGIKKDIIAASSIITEALAAKLAEMLRVLAAEVDTWSIAILVWLGLVGGARD